MLTIDNNSVTIDFVGTFEKPREYSVDQWIQMFEGNVLQAYDDGYKEGQLNPSQAALDEHTRSVATDFLWEFKYQLIRKGFSTELINDIINIAEEIQF